MSRPLRIEFPGATYHVTARGDRREAIFVDDTDRAGLLDVLAQGLQRFDAVALAYCLMGNHYHFVLQTRQANLSRLMRHVNGVHTQRFNRRHGKVGHLFQGRFKAILVDTDAYLLTLCRYVELNPVRAGWAADPLAWAWSSCRAHVGAAPAPVWLDTPGLHAQLIGRECRTAAEAAQGPPAVRLGEHVEETYDHVGDGEAHAGPEQRPGARPRPPPARSSPRSSPIVARRRTRSSRQAVTCVTSSATPWAWCCSSWPVSASTTS